MKTDDNRTTDRLGGVAFVCFLAAFLIIVMASGGCTSTVRPDIVPASAASYDGNSRTSRILEAIPEGIVVTPHWRERHNALVAKYGHRFVPPLAPDEGMAPRPDGTWLVDYEHAKKYIKMAAWERSGIAP